MLHRKEQSEHQAFSKAHYVDGPPPSRAEVWGEFLTWSVAGFGLLSVIVLAIIFFVAMNIFSEENSQRIIQSVEAHLQILP